MKNSAKPCKITMGILIAFALILIGNSPVLASSDNFADAAEITGESGETECQNTEATKESGEPDHAGNSGGHSVWYKWTAPVNGFFAFSTDESDFDTLLAIYTGDALASLIKVAANDDIGTETPTSRVVFNAQQGVVYHIAVDGYFQEEDDEEDSGDIFLSWEATTLPPANDDFVNAAALAGTSGQITGSNINATWESNEPQHADSPVENSVWWKWTAPENKKFVFDTKGSDFGTIIAVYSGSDIGGLTEAAGSSSGLFGVSFEAQSGAEYHIVVDGDFDGPGQIVLNWRIPSPPVNDNFSDALMLAGSSGQTTGSLTDATSEADELPHAESPAANSVWWKWIAPESTTFAFNTKGSHIGTVISIYTKGTEGLSEAASGEDFSDVMLQAQGGTEYYIAVDVSEEPLPSDDYPPSEFGNVVLNWRIPTPPDNDDFMDAVVLTGTSGKTSGSNTDATKETEEPPFYIDLPGGGSVWWEWTAPESDYFTFDTHGTDFDTMMLVYTGSNIGSLKEVKASDDCGDYKTSSVTFPAVEGTTYYISVEGYSGENGEIILNWRKPEGIFTAKDSGLVEMDWLYDGGSYKGELGIFSLKGMEYLEFGSQAFIAEAVRRVLSDSEDGHLVLSDSREGARFSGALGEPAEWNSGEYKGVKSFGMKSEDRFATILIPNGTFQSLANNPATTSADLRPLFSLVSSNPVHGMYLGQIADINGMGMAFSYEDMSADNSDRDYNDLIIQIFGATIDGIPSLNDLKYGSQQSRSKRSDSFDWRTDTELGRLIMEHLSAQQVRPETVWLSANINTDDYLLVYSPDGNMIGGTGGHIPGATFGVDIDGHRFVRLPRLEDGDYRLVIRSTGDGHALLNVRTRLGEDEILSEQGGSVKLGAHKTLVSDMAVYGTGDGFEIELGQFGESSAGMYDFDGNGVIDDTDIEAVSSLWNVCSGDERYVPFYDIDDDGCITVLDIMAVAGRM